MKIKKNNFFRVGVGGGGVGGQWEGRVEGGGGSGWM